MSEEFEEEDAEDRPLRTRQNISFFKRILLKMRFLSPIQKVILIVVILIILAGVIFIFHAATDSSQNTNSPSETPTLMPSDTPTEEPSPSPIDTSNSNSSSYVQPSTADVSPTVACVGPDGKQFYTTQQQCESFNGAWATPTPTQIPTTPTVTPTPTSTDSPTSTPTPTTTPGA